MAKTYNCPKCGGVDYFMSNRNVMKGIGGIYGNRGGVKSFPVCKVCDEIMSIPRVKFKWSKRTKLLSIPALVAAGASFFSVSGVAYTVLLTAWYIALAAAGFSALADYKKARQY
jgi:hypothetical protein